VRLAFGIVIVVLEIALAGNIASQSLPRGLAPRA
jgi:hypothetical protein